MEKISDIYLYGASGHAKVVHSIVKLNALNIISYIDDNKDLNYFNGYEVVHDFQNLNISSNAIFISIGNNFIRQLIASKLFSKSPTLVHPFTFIDSQSTIGIGSVVMANVSINSDVKIGSFCIINTNSSIDHDCLISDFVHISPNVALAGNVEIGEGSNIGIGSSVIQGIKIGKWVTIGAGAVIINNIPDYAVVVGNPGRVIKFNKFKSDE
jgi:sugar O-acyltransferase (sialic acid O-acetyltransferase NeuD family)